VKQADIDEGAGPAGALTSSEREELAALRRENKTLRMEREILKRAAAFLRQGERVKFAFIEAEQVAFPVAVLCRVLEVSPSGYYASKKRRASARAQANAVLAVEVKAVHGESGRRYGSPRVHAELRARGRRVGRRRVARLMRAGDLAARRKRRFRRTTESRHAMPVAPNLLARNFNATAPDQASVTDITYVWTREGWLYLAAIVDLYSRRVVGWSMSERIDRALSALEMAVRRRRPRRGLVHHSDRGCQYASADYQSALRGLGIVCSMSRKGDCWDNAVAESFFATLKNELVHHADYPTRAAARTSVFEFIKGFYNGRRRHSTIGYVSPAEFELLYVSRSEAA
jgi:transposase InsO family protein